MGNTNKNGDAREKKRERDRRRREKIKNDPEMYREFRESERERYLRRKQEKKALPIRELPIQRQKIVRQRNREAARAFYQRLKAKRLQTDTEVKSEPWITLPPQREQSQDKDPLTLSPALECSRYDLRSGHRDMTKMGPEITNSAESRGSSSLLVPHSSTALTTLSTLIKTSGSDLEQNQEENLDNASSENEKFIPHSTPTSCSESSHLRVLIKTSGLDLEENQEENLDNANSENEKFIPHSTPTSCSESSHLRVLIKTSGSDLEQNREENLDNASSENEKFIPHSTPTSCSESSHLRVKSYSFICTCNSGSSKIKPNRQTSSSRQLLRRYRHEANKEINHLNKKICYLKMMNNKYKKQIQWLRKNQSQPIHKLK